jgi:hypothetical protein
MTQLGSSWTENNSYVLCTLRLPITWVCIIFTLQQLHITLIWLEKPFTSWPATTNSKFETQVAHLMYNESHIVEDPTASFTFICSASSFGNMRATSPTSATRTSTLNHVSGIGVKWNLCSPPKSLIVPVATFWPVTPWIHEPHFLLHWELYQQ